MPCARLGRSGPVARSALFLFYFYAAAVLSAIAISVVGKVPSLHIQCSFWPLSQPGAAILFLPRFLRSNA
jgi:hypothetical protein